jgi:metal-dependent amidase/aminoacylase/carboxypeptidase family protein
LVVKVAAAAAKVVGEDSVVDPEPVMGAEDMSFFLNAVDGMTRYNS